jgi:tryptophan-rich sensory protein
LQNRLIVKKKIAMAALFASGVAASALLGTRFTPAPGSETGQWYQGLEKPPFNPPNTELSRSPNRAV